MREYVYIEQLVELTPWTVQAVEAMVRRGFFQCGVHYFQPQGRRGRLIFKWSAVAELIEQNIAQETPKVVESTEQDIPGPNGNANADVEQATTALYRMLD